MAKLVLLWWDRIVREAGWPRRQREAPRARNRDSSPPEQGNLKQGFVNRTTRGNCKTGALAPTHKRGLRRKGYVWLRKFLWETSKRQHISQSRNSTTIIGGDGVFVLSHHYHDLDKQKHVFNEHSLLVCVPSLAVWLLLLSD